MAELRKTGAPVVKWKRPFTHMVTRDDLDPLNLYVLAHHNPEKVLDIITADASASKNLVVLCPRPEKKFISTDERFKKVIFTSPETMLSKILETVHGHLQAKAA